VSSALGSRFGGWSFFVKDGTPVAVMAASQLEGDQSRVAASETLPAGRSKLTYRFVVRRRRQRGRGLLRSASTDARSVAAGSRARSRSSRR
jgi:hypothetical protein